MYRKKRRHKKREQQSNSYSQGSYSQLLGFSFTIAAFFSPFPKLHIWKDPLKSNNFNRFKPCVAHVYKLLKNTQATFYQHILRDPYVLPTSPFLISTYL